MGSMHIVCPHCTTSYAIKLETLGVAGRTVRCSRCKEVWLARPEDAIDATATVPAMAGPSGPAPPVNAVAEWEAMAHQEEAREPPVVDSPSISADWPAEDEEPGGDGPSAASGDGQAFADAAENPPRRLPQLFRLPLLPRFRMQTASLPTISAAMAALIAALMIWRTDVVRLLPQTVLFYKMAGLDVNLRGVSFEDIKVSDDTVDGKPVLVIEGIIVGQMRKEVELPRLRFSVRDAQGAEIYAWNTVLEQTVLKPGERAFFKSRLASPPAEGRSIDIRFFNKRDLTGGQA
jgi:predicted Zn finger-like uncharacterized protein